MGGLINLTQDFKSLPPEEARVDLLQFEGTLGAAGIVTAPPVIQTRTDYWTRIRGITGYTGDMTGNLGNVFLITFNIEEVGRGWTIFRRAISMGQLVTSLGTPANVLDFTVGHLLRPGSDLQLTYTLAAGWGGGNRVVGVTLICDLIKT